MREQVSTKRVYRIQDKDGRGPYKPGFSKKWCDAEGDPPPPTWMDEFPGLLAFMRQFNSNYGTAVRSVADLSNWFTPTEMQRLERFGYRIVAMDVDRILAESPNQLVFARTKPLKEDVEILEFPRIAA